MLINADAHDGCWAGDGTNGDCREEAALLCRDDCAPRQMSTHEEVSEGDQIWCFWTCFPETPKSTTCLYSK